MWTTTLPLESSVALSPRSWMTLPTRRTFWPTKRSRRAEFTRGVCSLLIVLWEDQGLWRDWGGGGGEMKVGWGVGEFLGGASLGKRAAGKRDA